MALVCSQGQAGQEWLQGLKLGSWLGLKLELWLGLKLELWLGLKLVPKTSPAEL
jgi:hypothetical protein